MAARWLGVLRGFEFFERGRLRILMYHRFTSGKHPHRISADAFEEQLRYLSERANVISLDTATKALEEGGLPPYAVVITIDDGYRDAYDIAFPLLKKYEMPATVFAVTGLMDNKCWIWTDIPRYLLLNTKKERTDIQLGGTELRISPKNENDRLGAAGKINDRLKEMPDDEKESALLSLSGQLEVDLPESPVEEYMGITPDQAREMDRNGVSIESHTSAHPIMTRIDPERMFQEAVSSRSRLEEVLDREVNHFCYPNGTFDREAAKAVKKAGYISAVSTVFGSCRPGDDMFSLKRIAAEPVFVDFLQNVTGFENLKRRIRSLRT